jgi:hypothetical protein
MRKAEKAEAGKLGSQETGKLKKEGEKVIEKKMRRWEGEKVGRIKLKAEGSKLNGERIKDKGIR